MSHTSSPAIGKLSIADINGQIWAFELNEYIWYIDHIFKLIHLLTYLVIFSEKVAKANEKPHPWFNDKTIQHKWEVFGSLTQIICRSVDRQWISTGVESSLQAVDL